MKQPMRMVTAAVAAMTMTALIGAPSASATTLEIGGVAQNKEVALDLSLATASLLKTDTAGIVMNTCTASNMKIGTVNLFSGITIGGPVAVLSYGNCSEGNPTVDAAGTLTIERIGTTTNGTVRSSGTKTTTPSFFGNISCTTENRDIGTLTGVASGNAALDINVVMDCDVFGTVKWSGSYTVTSPTGLGVTK